MKHVVGIVAGALALSASAAACVAQIVPIGTPALGGSAPPSFVTEAIGWGQGHATAPRLADSPLTSLIHRPSVALESEWAPLYRGRDGARIEHARQDARAGASSGRWLAGADLSRETSMFRGGESEWGFDAGGSPARGGTVALGIAQRRAAAAFATSLVQGAGIGFAAEARAGVAPGWSASLRASDLAREGSLDVRYEDEAIAARGRWSERRAVAGLEAETRSGRFSAALESFDRVPTRDRTRPDGLAPRLAWRGARVAWLGASRGALLTAELRHGEGRQRLEVARSGTAYAVAAGPVREDVALVGGGPLHARWQGRAWIGRSHDSASGSLALWPFDGLAALAGTRYAAHTDLDLRHAGIAVEGSRADRRGWDAGLALWVIEPRGSYSTWRGTLFALGRDDYRDDGIDLSRVWLAGLRLARTQDIAWVRLRAEAIQWAPAHVERGHAEAGVPPGPPGGGGEPSSPKGHTRDWGGTVVRVSLELPASASMR